MTCCPGGWDNGHAYWCAGPKPVEGKRLRVTRLDAEGNPTGETIEVGDALTTIDPGILMIPEDLKMPETLSMDVAFMQPDPEVMDLLTGGWGRLRPPAPTHHAIEVRYRLPVRRRAWRVVWEWLTRKPRQYTDNYFCVPYAEVSRNPDGSMTFRPIHPESESAT